MRLRIIISILLAGIVVYGQQYNSFSRFSGNPIVTKSTGNFDSGDIANPDVFYDVPNNRWVMNYSAYGTIPGDASAKWRMCLAYSPDLYNWTKEATNPVFSPTAGEGYIACNGSIVYKAGTYYHFYNTGPNGTLVGNYNRLATSSDLLNWTRVNGGNPIGLQPTPGTFDQDGVYDPCVILLPDGVTFEAFYAAKNGSINSIGWATSVDGITWYKKGQLLTQQGWWNTSNFAEPCGQQMFGGLLLTYDAPITTNVRNIAGGITYNYGNGWQFYGFMLLGSGGSTNWDRTQVFDSYIFPYKDTLRLFYAGGIAASGTQGMGSQIGVATLPLKKQNK